MDYCEALLSGRQYLESTRVENAQPRLFYLGRTATATTASSTLQVPKVST